MTPQERTHQALEEHAMVCACLDTGQVAVWPASPYPVLYRWLSYGPYGVKTTWRAATAGKMSRACRALRMPGEAIEVVYDTGQRVVARVRAPQRGLIRHQQETK